MKTIRLSLLAGAVWLAACGGDETPAERQFLIQPADAVSVTSLMMRTAALVGRHAVIPNGASMAPETQPACPITGAEDEGGIQIAVKACMPDFANFGEPSVDCTFEETYACEYVNGVIDNVVAMRGDGLDFSLTMSEYVEGNASIGSVQYDGTISAETTPDGITTYREALDIHAITTAETRVQSTSAVTVETTATGWVLTGQTFLAIEGRGPGRLDFQDVEFSHECEQSPVSGEFQMVLIGLERATLRVDGCGELTFVNYVGTTPDRETKLPGTTVSDIFALTLPEVQNFTKVAFNVTPAAPVLADEETATRWCAPYTPVIPVLSDESGGDVTVTDNVMMECLAFQYGEAGTTFTHVIIEDKATFGLFADPTQVDVHYLQAGLATSGEAGALTLMWVQRYDGEPELPVALADIDEEEDVNAFCDPQVTNDEDDFYCPRRPLHHRVDHFGLGFLDQMSIPPAGFYYVHIME